MLGTSSVAGAEGTDTVDAVQAPVFATGAWQIEAGEIDVRLDSGGYFVDVHEARIGRDDADAWALSAEQVTFDFGALGHTPGLYARGDVRVVARDLKTGEMRAYAMGEYAWVDSSGAHGVLAGPGVALMRDGWQIEASQIDIDFGDSTYLIRGIASGPVRAQGTDN